MQADRLLLSGIRIKDVFGTFLNTVATCHRPEGVGTAIPARLEALTQAELQPEDAALQVPGCRECLGPLSEVRRDGPPLCRRCAILQELCCQVKSLWEQVNVSCCIKEYEWGIDRLLSATDLQSLWSWLLVKSVHSHHWDKYGIWRRGKWWPLAMTRRFTWRLATTK